MTRAHPGTGPRNAGAARLRYGHVLMVRRPLRCDRRSKSWPQCAGLPRLICNGKGVNFLRVLSPIAPAPTRAGPILARPPPFCRLITLGAGPGRWT